MHVWLTSTEAEKQLGVVQAYYQNCYSYKLCETDGLQKLRNVARIPHIKRSVVMEPVNNEIHKISQLNYLSLLICMII